MNHFELGQIESLAIDGTDWDRWIDDLESLVGYSLDGDQIQDGYSYDYLYDAYLAAVLRAAK